MAKRKLMDVIALGREGGKARAQNMTPDARKEGARKAAKARWGKKKEAAEK
jgi:hypothetical protein